LVVGVLNTVGRRHHFYPPWKDVHILSVQNRERKDSTLQSTSLPDAVGNLFDEVRLASVQQNDVSEFGLPTDEQFGT